MTNRTTDEDFVEAFAYEHFDNPRPSGSGFTVCCPVPDHDDQSPSLSIGLGDNGAVLLHCFGGCEVAEVLDALGLTFRDLFPTSRPRSWKPRPNREAALWEWVAERALEQQQRESEPWYWEYRAAILEWGGNTKKAQACRRHAQLLAGEL